jgi:general L-amino acid transport system substrate-binding protein
MHVVLRLIFACAGWVLLASVPALAESTLETVKKRDQLVCGVNGTLPGFSLFNAVKEWEGLDVDYCRAVAAAVLGDARKVKYVPLTAEKRFNVLAAGEIDMLARNSTGTLTWAAGGKVRFVTVNYYDGQAFVVPKTTDVQQAASLRGAMICTQRGTTHLFNMKNWFGVRRLEVLPVEFDSVEDMYNAFFGSRCLAVTADATALASTLVRMGRAGDYRMLPDIISKEPLGPYVRAGDEQWLDIVRWTHYALLEAEEYDIRSNNVDEKRQGHEPLVRRLLGVEPGNGKILGLDEAWAYNAIAQVGNYSEIYERNVGMASPLRFARGVNALWSKGGLMYPLPLR